MYVSKWLCAAVLAKLMSEFASAVRPATPPITFLSPKKKFVEFNEPQNIQRRRERKNTRIE